MHWVSVLIHSPVLKSGFLYYFFQTAIYRKAVKYLTSFFLLFHIPLIGEHPVLPNNQPSLWEYRTKKKKYEYFCTMCNKEIFMHHKEFLVCLCAINYYYY